MATKKEELANPNGCLNRSQDDEPIFVLVARDALAPEVVRLWAEKAILLGTPAAKVDEALELVAQMEAWQAAHFSKVPD